MVNFEDIHVGDVVRLRQPRNHENRYDWACYLGKDHVVESIDTEYQTIRIERCRQKYDWPVSYLVEHYSMEHNFEPLNCEDLLSLFN